MVILIILGSSHFLELHICFLSIIIARFFVVFDYLNFNLRVNNK